MSRAWCVLLAAVTLGSGAFAETPPAAPPTRQSPPAGDESAVDKEARANQTWQRLSLHEKLQLLRLHRALREMDPQDRDFIRERIDRYLRMTPEERRQFKENRQRWQQLSPEEKERARQEYRRRREEFEQRWREKHPGEEPPPSPPRERSPRPPPPEGAPPPPAQDNAPTQN